eukprot:jgi/Mesvir1/371/Mv11267-RA.1
MNGAAVVAGHPGGAAGGAVPAPGSAEEKKNTDCRYFMLGVCQKGPACEYRHSAAAKFNPVDCTFWAANKCAKADCPFRHPLRAWAPPPAAFAARNQTPCIYHMQGKCVKGAACAFSHAVAAPSASLASIMISSSATDDVSMSGVATTTTAVTRPFSQLTPHAAGSAPIVPAVPFQRQPPPSDGFTGPVALPGAAASGTTVASAQGVAPSGALAIAIPAGSSAPAATGSRRLIVKPRAPDASATAAVPGIGAGASPGATAQPRSAHLVPITGRGVTRGPSGERPVARPVVGGVGVGGMGGASQQRDGGYVATGRGDGGQTSSRSVRSVRPQQQEEVDRGVVWSVSGGRLGGARGADRESLQVQALVPERGGVVVRRAIVVGGGDLRVDLRRPTGAPRGVVGDEEEEDGDEVDGGFERRAGGIVGARGQRGEVVSAGARRAVTGIKRQGGGPRSRSRSRSREAGEVSTSEGEEGEYEEGSEEGEERHLRVDHRRGRGGEREEQGEGARAGAPRRRGSQRVLVIADERKRVVREAAAEEEEEGYYEDDDDGQVAQVDLRNVLSGTAVGFGPGGGRDQGDMRGSPARRRSARANGEALAGARNATRGGASAVISMDHGRVGGRDGGGGGAAGQRGGGGDAGGRAGGGGIGLGLVQRALRTAVGDAAGGSSGGGGGGVGGAGLVGGQGARLRGEGPRGGVGAAGTRADQRLGMAGQPVAMVVGGSGQRAWGGGPAGMSAGPGGPPSAMLANAQGNRRSVPEGLGGGAPSGGTALERQFGSAVVGHEGRGAGRAGVHAVAATTSPAKKRPVVGTAAVAAAVAAAAAATSLASAGGRVREDGGGGVPGGSGMVSRVGRDGPAARGAERVAEPAAEKPAEFAAPLSFDEILAKKKKQRQEQGDGQQQQQQQQESRQQGEGVASTGSAGTGQAGEGAALMGRASRKRAADDTPAGAPSKQPVRAGREAGGGGVEQGGALASATGGVGRSQFRPPKSFEEIMAEKRMRRGVEGGAGGTEGAASMGDFAGEDGDFEWTEFEVDGAGANNRFSKSNPVEALARQAQVPGKTGTGVGALGAGSKPGSTAAAATAPPPAVASGEEGEEGEEEDAVDNWEMFGELEGADEEGAGGGGEGDDVEEDFEKELANELAEY